MSKWIRKWFFRSVLPRHGLRLYDHLCGSFAPPKTLGAKGELAAERFLLKQGLVILQRGYRTRMGEIDLIAVDSSRTVVFVEVKARTSEDPSESTEAVDNAKQQHITQTAKGYMKQHQLEACSVRFDVVAVLFSSHRTEPKIRYYPNAFESVGEYQIY